jgi:hypothetical protein
MFYVKIKKKSKYSVTKSILALNHCYFLSKGNFRLVYSLFKVPQPN